MKEKLPGIVRRSLTLCAASVFAASLPMASRAADAADASMMVSGDRVAGVRDLLAQGWDPNTLIDGQPAIMQAVRDGAWRVFDVLAADPRANVNIANSHDETPLMYLAIQGQVQRAQALIARGAKVNRLGWTPLHYAASKGQIGVAKLLMASGAIINAPGPDGTTPLMMAGYSGSKAMVDLLLQAGADATMQNQQGLDAAAWAASANHAELASELKQAAAAHEAQLGRATGNRAAPSASPPAAAVGGTQAAPQGSPAPPPSSGSQPEQGGGTLKGVEGIRLDSGGASSR
jgi:ankyrin repeat protein